MRKQLLPFVGIGVVVAGLGVLLTLFIQRGAHVELRGSIQKVRTLAVEEAAAIAVLDFRLVNPSDYLFVVREVGVSLEDRQGRLFEGRAVAEVDAQSLFQHFPALGPKYNATLVARTRVAPRQTLDRMLAARFELPEREIQARRGLKIRVEEVDGAVSELAEGGK